MKKLLSTLVTVSLLFSCYKSNDDYLLIKQIIGDSLVSNKEFKVLVLSLDGCIYCLDDAVYKINIDGSIDALILTSKNENTSKIFLKNINESISTYTYKGEIPPDFFLKNELKIILFDIDGGKIVKKEPYEIFKN